MVSASPRRLRDGPTDTMAAKGRTLAVLAAAGVRVPDGWIIPHPTECTEPSLRSFLPALVARGTVAVRSVGAEEDGPTHSGAGLGQSWLDVGTVRDVLCRLHGFDPAAQAIVQHQVRGRWLIVAAVTQFGIEIDAHDATTGLGADVLSGEATPAWSGRLARWTDPAQASVAATIEGAVRAAEDDGLTALHGWDLELVVGDEGIWVVQLRPLTAALHEGWSEFAAQVAADQQRSAPEFGPHILTLDAEHNPAPLSVAHGWVIDKLNADRGVAAGSPTVLAGWLYVATLPRDLDRPVADRGGAAALTPAEALARLVDTYLPQARARLDAVNAAVGGEATAGAVEQTLAQAWEAFLAMIDIYVGVLVPARRAAGRAQAEPDRDDPLTLRARAQYLDVLPTTWDIASPTLAEAGVSIQGAAAGSPRLPDDDRTAAILLSEWDDHLFALGMAPLRSVFRWVGRQIGAGDGVFLLRGSELAHAVGGRRPDLASRSAAQARRETLRPPQRIDAGCPVGSPRSGDHGGIPVGPSFAGPATIRRDLQSLLSNPPPPGSVVMMPALTAPAAVALREAGVSAVCSEHGGPLSHATLMARELGLSALIGCRGCTSVAEGTPVRLDTSAGRLRSGD